MKALVVDDHPIVISGLSALITDGDGIEILSARDAGTGVELFTAHCPDVTVVDINLPGTSGFELTRQLLDRDPEAKILIFSMNDDPMVAIEALDTGATGFASKNEDPEHLLAAIRATARGEVWLPETLAQEVALIRALPGQRVRLTSREIEMLRALSRGRSMSEIASELGLSYKTVAASCTSIRTKLKARTQAEMVRLALELKLV